MNPYPQLLGGNASVSALFKNVDRMDGWMAVLTERGFFKHFTSETDNIMLVMTGCELHSIVATFVTRSTSS